MSRTQTFCPWDIRKTPLVPYPNPDLLDPTAFPTIIHDWAMAIHVGSYRATEKYYLLTDIRILVTNEKQQYAVLPAYIDTQKAIQVCLISKKITYATIEPIGILWSSMTTKKSLMSRLFRLCGHCNHVPSCTSWHVITMPVVVGLLPRHWCRDVGGRCCLTTDGTRRGKDKENKRKDPKSIAHCHFGFVLDGSETFLGKRLL